MSPVLGLQLGDMKPANIMPTDVDDDGEQRILLTDFGIACSVDDIRETHLDRYDR